MMGGGIWLESELGKGSVFSFTVLAEQGTEKAREIPDQCMDAGLFKGRRVLLADDIEINREIVSTLLEPTCLEIDYAVNGAEAVRMFGETPDKYDMILMDIQMPEMDGYEATRRIRAADAPAAKTIPIVAMTANVFEDDVEQCLEAGMNGHVGKPLGLEEVMAVLRKYLPVPGC
jgi:CheY-like chemotaxis protein